MQEHQSGAIGRKRFEGRSWLPAPSSIAASLAPATAVHRRILAACHDQGLPPPTQNVVKNRPLLSRSRPSGREDASICLDRVAVRLDPRTVADGTLVLTVLGIRRDLRARVDDDRAIAQTNAVVLERSLRASGAGTRTAVLEIDSPDEEGWDKLFALLRAEGIELWTSAPRSLLSSRLARATFGTRIGRLGFKRIDARVLPRLRPDDAVSDEDRRTLADAIERDNEGRLGRPVTLRWSDGASFAGRLTAAFRAQGAMQTDRKPF